MTMAVDMVTAYAFSVLGLHRLEANVMPRNKASLRVLEKNGFLNEGLSKYYQMCIRDRYIPVPLSKVLSSLVGMV